MLYPALNPDFLAISYGENNLCIRKRFVDFFVPDMILRSQFRLFRSKLISERLYDFDKNEAIHIYDFIT